MSTLTILALLVSIATIKPNIMNFLFRVVLSMITAFGVFKLKRPDTFLILDIAKWDDAISEHLKNGNWQGFSLWTLFFFIFFYIILKLFTHNFYRKKRTEYYEKIFSDEGNNRYKNFISRKVSKNIFSKLIRFGILTKQNLKEAPSILCPEEFNSTITDTFSVFTHLTACWIVLLNPESYYTYLIIGIIYSIFIIILFFMPLFKFMHNSFLSPIINDELTDM